MNDRGLQTSYTRERGGRGGGEGAEAVQELCESRLRWPSWDVPSKAISPCFGIGHNCPEDVKLYFVGEGAVPAGTAGTPLRSGPVICTIWSDPARAKICPERWRAQFAYWTVSSV